MKVFFTRKLFRIPKSIMMFFGFMALMVIFMGLSGQKASASCPINFVGSNDGGNPAFVGDIYATYVVSAQAPNPNDVGNSYQVTCYMPAANGSTRFGRRASQIWMGNSAGPWSIAQPGCLASVEPSQGFGISRCSLSGNWAVYQDDASFISVNSNIIHCSGMVEVIGCGDVYYGITDAEASSMPCAGPRPSPPVTEFSPRPCWAVRGAGYMNHPGAEITSYVGTNPSGINDPAFEFKLKNTWSSGYGALLTVTLRYPPAPPSSTPTSTITGAIEGGPGSANVTYAGGAGLVPPNNTSPVNASTYAFTANVGTHQINADPVAGYNLLGSTLCVGSGFCDRSIGGPNYQAGGSRVTPFLNDGQTAYLHWHYEPISTPPPPPPSGNPAPIGDVNQVDCTQFRGWAFDPSNSGVSLQVRIYMNGSYWTDVTANVARPDVNSVYGISGDHGFSVPTPAVWQTDGLTHNMTFEASDILADGTLNPVNTNNTTIGGGSFGPSCGGGPGDPYGALQTVSCNAVTGYALDPDYSGPVNVNVYIDGVSAFSGLADLPGGPIPSQNHVFDLLIPSSWLAPGSTHNVSVYVQDVNSGGAITGPFPGVLLTGSGASYACPGTGVPPPPPPLPPPPPPILPDLSCSISFSPSNPEPSEPFSVTVTLTNKTSAPVDNISYPMNVSLNGAPPTTQTYLPSPLSSGSATANIVGLTAPATGSYTVVVTVNGPAASASCNKSLTPSLKPYFRVFSGDIIAGSGSGPTCTAVWGATLPSVGGIFGWSNKNGNGAGTQLLAQALSAIKGFSSAQSRSSSPSPDSGLTFSNTTNPPFGGDFGAANCPDDYWANKGTITANPATKYKINPGMSSGKYLFNPLGGNLELDGQQVGKGEIIVIYVDGNVTITKDIDYQDSGGTWASTNDIPSLTIVARGNIFIDANVSTINAVLIAQPKPLPLPSHVLGGTVYTCSVSPGGIGAPPTKADMAGGSGICKANQLTITGAVIAHVIKLYRSSGTVKDAKNADIYQTSTAAEKFIYSPEIWLRNNGVKPGPKLGTFDAITSLPPIL